MVISHKNEEKGEYCVKVKRFHECPDCHRIVPYLQRKCDCGYVFSGGEREYKTCVACGSLIPASRLFCDCGKFLPMQRDTLTEGDVETAYQEGRFAGVAEERTRQEGEWSRFFRAAGLKNTFTGEPISSAADFYSWKEACDAEKLRRDRSSARSKFEKIAANYVAAIRIRKETEAFIRRFGMKPAEQLLAYRVAIGKWDVSNVPSGVDELHFGDLCDYYSAEQSMIGGFPFCLSLQDILFCSIIEFANCVRKIFPHPDADFICDDGYFTAAGSLNAVGEIFLSIPRADSVAVKKKISSLCAVSEDDAAIIDDNMKIAADNVFASISGKGPSELLQAVSFAIQKMLSDTPNIEEPLAITQVIFDFIRAYVDKKVLVK